MEQLNCEPVLYRYYSRPEALALFGKETNAQVLCDGQWVLFPAVAMCLTTIGHRPRHPPPYSPHFLTGSYFRWVAEKPLAVIDAARFRFLPEEVEHSNTSGLPLHLFVRPEHAPEYLYVGRLRRSGMHFGPGRRGEACFYLSPTLPSAIWLSLGTLSPGSVSDGAIDAALDLLRGPTTPDERLALLQQLVEYWHGPIVLEDGIPHEELSNIQLPMPLRWWYRWAGRRSEIMGGEHFLFAPDDLEMRDGLLLFYDDGAGSYEWATPSEGDDPPVFGRVPVEGAPFTAEGLRLTEHLTLACLFSAITCHAPYAADAVSLPQEALDRIVETVPPLAIPAWKNGIRFYARNGAFMWSSPQVEWGESHGHRVWIGARTEHPLQFLRSFPDIRWEQSAL